MSVLITRRPEHAGLPTVRVPGIDLDLVDAAEVLRARMDERDAKLRKFLKDRGIEINNAIKT